MGNQQGTAIEPRLAVIDGQVTATSLTVAEHFDKRHADILRAIKHLECSEEFRRCNFALVNETMSYVNSIRDIRKLIAETGKWGLLNFEETPYIDQWNRQQLMYRITKEGFVMPEKFPLNFETWLSSVSILATFGEAR